MVFHVQRTQQSRQVIQDAEWPLQFGWQLQLNRPTWGRSVVPQLPELRVRLRNRRMCFMCNEISSERRSARMLSSCYIAVGSSGEPITFARCVVPQLPEVRVRLRNRRMVFHVQRTPL
jgi:hypothetical protein